MFERILEGLRATASRLSLVDNRISDIFFSFTELCEVCSERSKVRPFCSMVRSKSVKFIKEKSFCYHVVFVSIDDKCRALAAQGGMVRASGAAGNAPGAFLCRVGSDGGLG